MGSSLSEPCIYDKLSESIDILRQSGYRYGMSEREIEKFIKQVLETNEPRRDPPQFPILRPPSSHARLLELPIARKHNLHSFHEWWASGALQMPHVYCSACAGVTAALQLRTSGGESLSRRVSHLEQFSRPQTVTPTPANFTLLWSFSSSPRETVLQWLFPDTELCPLLENTGTTLQRCQITDSTNAQHTRVQVLGWLVVAEGSPSVRVLPVQRCQNYCSSFSLWLEPGDMVYADPRYWLMELFPSGGQSVLCDGPVL
ncbi:bombesin receptor-activated C6orf89-like protein [Labeo rohita]|uniref:Bombesin receptor-activated C6orf89-like protein n=1 Tax=Labeo rohita TaxID=84645 RepID=A0A498NWT6_LABRO|nr:bombesin receptor-activated C6orf89-like protein [Labeo rohita]